MKREFTISHLSNELVMCKHEEIVFIAGYVVDTKIIDDFFLITLEDSIGRVNVRVNSSSFDFLSKNNFKNSSLFKVKGTYNDNKVDYQIDCIEINLI